MCCVLPMAACQVLTWGRVAPLPSQVLPTGLWKVTNPTRNDPSKPLLGTGTPIEGPSGSAD